MVCSKCFRYFIPTSYQIKVRDKRCQKCRYRLVQNPWKQRNKQYSVKYYKKNKKRINKVIKQWERKNWTKVLLKAQKHRAKFRQKLFEIKAKTPCFDCGKKFHPCCMDYHHVNRASKKFQISSGWSRNFKKVIQEIKKCILVCANCHRIRTYKQRLKGKL